MFMGVERDCYYKLKRICLDSIGRITCLGSMQIKLHERTIGMSQACPFFFFMILFTKLYWDFKSSYRFGGKIFPFRCFIWLIMFKITITYFLKAHSHICICIPKLCIMVSVYCSCITGRC